MRVAVDAMGGDLAPGEVVRGAVEAVRAGLAEVLLVGPAALVREELERCGGTADVAVVDAPEVIRVDEAPVIALRRKKRSSIAVGLQLVRRGEADAFVSAGSTGALVAGGFLTFGPIPGVERPALSGIFPTLDGRGCLFLDLGAHMDATARQLYQYGVMGAVFAEKVLRVREPRVALLNVGVEENKGNQVTRQAYQVFKHSHLRFHGNIEARDLFLGKADVVVCDGFVGNVLLKAVEGTGESLLHLMRQEVGRGWRERLGALFLRPALRRLAARMDYREHGGTPILGVNGVCIKCHGSSNATAIRNGVRVARETVAGHVVELIQASLSGAGETA
ncbi:MAG: phosphate acyltransferase PlsX [Clostridia bacterium]|nr:phosphate acyltransferase PlsX [Clostridia bacterium]